MVGTPPTASIRGLIGPPAETRPQMQQAAHLVSVHAGWIRALTRARSLELVSERINIKDAAGGDQSRRLAPLDFVSRGKCQPEPERKEEKSERHLAHSSDT